MIYNALKFLKSFLFCQKGLHFFFWSMVISNVIALLVLYGYCIAKVVNAQKVVEVFSGAMHGKTPPDANLPTLTVH
jgi:hypothetical protein